MAYIVMKVAGYLLYYIENNGYFYFHIPMETYRITYQQYSILLNHYLLCCLAKIDDAQEPSAVNFVGSGKG